jgi:predicted nucleic acid-binding protein
VPAALEGERRLAAGRRARVLDALRGQAAWFALTERVNDRREAKDNKYLELALASGAWAIASGGTTTLPAPSPRISYLADRAT